MKTDESKSKTLKKTDESKSKTMKKTDESKSKMMKKIMNNRTEDVRTYKTKFLRDKTERTKANAGM